VASNLSGQWTELQNLFNGKKLVTLSETGNLPNPEFIRTFGTWWSWFAVWNGADHLRKQSTTLLSSVFNDPDVLTQDELPDWRTYRSLTSSNLELEFAQLTVFPNPAETGNLHISATVKAPVKATFTLFNTTGIKVAEVTKQFASGPNLVKLPLQQLPAGIYVLSIQKGNEQISRKVVVQR
jgi:mannan endo-1,4-beta-mannosidase